MHIVDILVGIILIVGLSRGYRRGFVLQFISLVSAIAAFIIAYQFYPLVAKLIRPFFNLQEFQDMFSLPIPINISINEMVATAVAFALLFFVARILLMVVGRTLHAVAQLPLLNTANRILGVMMSFAEILIVLVIVVNVGSMLPIESVQNMIEQSAVSQYILQEFGFVREKMLALLQEATL